MSGSIYNCYFFHQIEALQHQVKTSVPQGGVHSPTLFNNTLLSTYLLINKHNAENDHSLLKRKKGGPTYNALCLLKHVSEVRLLFVESSSLITRNALAFFQDQKLQTRSFH